MENVNQIESNNQKEAISKFVSTLVPSEKGEVWLYGSRARGDYEPDSDWDILILLNQTSSFEKDFDEYAYPLVEFGWKNNLELNPLIYSKSNWNRHPKNLFHHNVQKDRIRL